MQYLTLQQLEQTASRRELPAGTYKGCLRSTNQFIQEMVRSLKLPAGSIVSSMVLFQRYSAEMSIVRSDRYMIATAALFLLAKAIEHPKPVSQMIRHMLGCCRKGPNADREANEVVNNRDSPQYKHLSEGLMMLEHQMLVMLGFDVLNLPDAYKVFIKAWQGNSHIQQLNQQHRERVATETDPHKRDPNYLMQNAWNFINDSCGTSLPIQFPVEQLVYGCIAALLHVLSLPTETAEGQPWYLATWPTVTPEEVAGIVKVRKTLLKQYGKGEVKKRKQQHSASACGASGGGKVPAAAPRPQPSSPGSGELAITSNGLGSKRGREDDGVVESAPGSKQQRVDVNGVGVEPVAQQQQASVDEGVQPPARLESGEIEAGEIVA